MALYTTVMTTRSCHKCGRECRCDVQFKTGEEKGQLPHCDEFETLPAAPPGTYEGLVDAYCPECLVRRMNDETEAQLLVLAESVTRGVLTVRRGRILRDGTGGPIPDPEDDFQIAFLDDRVLLAEEIAATSRAAIPTRIQSTAALLHHLDLVVFEGSRRAFPTRLTTRSTWWDRHDAAVARRVVDRGWTLGSPWTDVSVVVSPEHVVTVEPDRCATRAP